MLVMMVSDSNDGSDGSGDQMLIMMAVFSLG